MNQQFETLIKAALIILSMLLGTQTIPLFDEGLASLIASAVVGGGAVVIDQWSTFRLKKQGIVSTDPQANIDAPGTPRTLVAEEKKEARAAEKESR